MVLFLILQAEQDAQVPKRYLKERISERDGWCDGDSSGIGESVNMIKYIVSNS